MPPRTAPVASSPDAQSAPYSLRQIRQMLGLSRRAVTGLIAAGFVVPQRGPRNAYRFSFQDVVLLRTAHQLREAKIGPRRLLRSLKQLKAKLPDQMPLSGLRIKVIGNDVAVRDAGSRWEAPSGQLLLDFEMLPASGGAATTTPVLPVARAASEHGLHASGPKFLPPASDPNQAGTPRRGEFVGGASAPIRPGGTAASHQSDAKAPSTAELFTLALQHESADDAGAAERAYRQLLAAAPDHLDAAINLSAMLCDAGRCQDAIDTCDQAIAAIDNDNRGPGPALLHFNRALALEDQRRPKEALLAYASALELDPSLADAHFNAARLHEQLGHAKDALRHFSAYRRLQRE